MIKLESCDVLLFVDEGTGWTSVISQWGIGRYNHAAIYLGNFLGAPFLYQSMGRGVLIQSLLPDTGKLALVMRIEDGWKANKQRLDIIGALDWVQIIIESAFEIASDPQSYYDYLCIIDSCLPRVLKEKFPWLPIPVKYHRDKAMICSEAVAEVFWRAGVEVLPQDIVPLPGDFVASPVLKIMGEGRVMEDIVP